MKVSLFSWLDRFMVVCLVLLVLVSIPVQADFTEGLVHRWTFNDAKAPLVDDIARVSLTNGGDVTLKDGMAIFNGSPASFLYSTDPRVNSERFGGEKPFTIWVKFQVDSFSETENMRLIRRNIDGTTKNTSFSLNLYRDTFSTGVICGSTLKGAPNPKTPSIKKESAVALAFLPKLHKRYSNGEEQEKVLNNISLNDLGIFTVGQLVYHDGEEPEGMGQAFIGRIDEIRIYDGCLSKAELDAIEVVPQDPSPFANPSYSSDETRITHHTETLEEIRESTYDERTWRDMDIKLGPTEVFTEGLSLPVPFYQGIPLKEGELFLRGENVHLTYEDTVLPAYIRPAALWPDGSVRWLAIDGIWPEGLYVKEGVSVKLSPGEYRVKNLYTSPILSLRKDGNTLELISSEGKILYTLSPEAKVLRITEPKAAQSRDPSYLDERGQFVWAEPIEVLNPDGEPLSLSMSIRECEMETENSLYTLYRVRGDGGDLPPGNGLEWQLRVRIYHNAPMVRFQMTWAFHWDPDEYALASAKWILEPSEPLNEVNMPGITRTFSLANEEVCITSTPEGRVDLIHSDGDKPKTDLLTRLRLKIFRTQGDGHILDFPDPSMDYCVLKGDEDYISLGIPNMTRLGPNHISINRERIEFAAWNGESGYALDLRSTLTPGEFGISAGDLKSTAVGLGKTVEMSLCWADTLEDAALLAKIEAQRDNLWFTSLEELARTGAVEPWEAKTFDLNREYFNGLAANIHFVLASRDKWRWNGFINYGDFKTNYPLSVSPEKGLYAGHWALYGRYGWRNGSAQAYRGLFYAGLALQDREILMSAVDYALHVADVDICHPSFFSEAVGTQGGMHRRNRDHWSGSIQVQYTPSSGLYLAKWLTGYERFSDCLEEIRGYVARNDPMGSAFAGSAWINHYAETHEPASLVMAERLLLEAAAFWEASSNLPNLSGISALYADNFRGTLDGYPVIIEFHQITGDKRYLDALLESVRHYGPPEEVDVSLGEYYGMAYLLTNGVSEEDLGLSRSQVSTLRTQLEGVIPSDLPSSSKWNYKTLENIITKRLPPIGNPNYRESGPIGWRSIYAPLVLRYFGKR